MRRAEVLRRLVYTGLLGGAALWVALAAPAGHAVHSVAPELSQDPTGHQGLEGVALVAARGVDRGTGASRCSRRARVRSYDVVALDVDITLNRYGDHDPQGRMYALADQVPLVRTQERSHEVSTGLQGDAIQPLVLRVLPGECLRLSLRNDLRGEGTSFHLHGLPLVVVSSGRAARESEPTAVAPPGGTVVYEWAVPRTEPDGTHYAHSHGSTPAQARSQTEHGLYGAVVVEPAGSRWSDPRTGTPARGWDAVVTRPDGSSFREFALFYAEDGDEPYQPLTRSGQYVPLVDDLTGAYKPDGRWISYRSEPFLNRMALSKHIWGRYDESGAYSSYAFGDPATPLMRSYLGDPVVQRVVHAGSEVLHVHHVHGGSIRWRRQPGLGPTGATVGFTKTPDLLPGPSERTDSQSMAPAETFDQWNECGSGGCQGSVGDFLWHCHVAHHYFAGMWGLWRVYATLQNGPASTDTLPPLRTLPDRTTAVLPAVPASQLVGTAVDLAGHRAVVTPAALTSWLRRVLPPPGRRRGYGAGVWDWERSGSDVLGEPEDSHVWPGYRSPIPGRRPEVLFDPRTGLPAYPMLRPHLGMRPPFAPGHGPAPYLDPTDGVRLPPPGSDGPHSVCPAGTTIVPLPVTALLTAVQLAPGISDPHGELYVPNSELAAYRASAPARVPLVVRARAQRDCVDVTLVSALADDAETHGLSKADLHIHFVQFDVQGSDGVVAGFNNEQSVRPWRTATVPLATAAPAGSRTLVMSRVPLCQAGEALALGPERPAGPEVVQVTAVHGRILSLRDPLTQDHPADEPASTEFVRYRWYPDAQTGTTYFHDHVDAVSSWRHGLFGALIVEPPDATWTDPRTGALVPSGATADITTKGAVGVDTQGPFRELVTLLQDDARVNQTAHSTGGALGMRASPPLGQPGPPATVVQAYIGDPVVFRTLVPATNDVHTFWLEGHGFRVEPWSRTSPVVGALHVGISERYDVVVPHAGGPARRPGDYVFGDGRTSKLREGVWGVLRVLGQPSRSLRALAGRRPGKPDHGPICPAGAAVTTVDVTATDLDLPALGPGAAAFVPTRVLPAVRRNPTLAEPLTLHVPSGGCLRIHLRNTTHDPVALTSSLLPGADPPTVDPGAEDTEDLWAAPELGETVGLLLDTARPLAGPSRGLYGAVVVVPAGAVVVDPRSGDAVADGAGSQVVVRPAGGSPYRDLSVFVHDSDGDLGTHQMPYRHAVTDQQAVSYRTAPDAPVLLARVGEPIRLHVVAAVSEQLQGFALDGHRWPLEPGSRGSSVVAAQALGGREVFTVVPVGGAGGEGHLPGDYVYGDTRGPYRDAGVWGVLRVLPSHGGELRPLTPASRVPEGLALAALLSLLMAGWWLRSRSRPA